MKKGPDLILVLTVLFVLGSVVTGVSKSDLQLAAVVQQAINS